MPKTLQAYTLGMVDQLVTLPDGTQAVLIRSMTWGDAVTILLLAALVLLTVYNTWRQH